MPSPHYLDANALMRWAEGKCAAPTADQSAASARVEAFIVDADVTVSISEVTIIEFLDIVLRYRWSPNQEWDETWMFAVQTQFMEWIESAHITVHPPAPRAIDVAISYVSLARSVGIALKAMDAIHLSRALEWSHELGTTVTLVTGDRAFSRFLDAFPTAQQFIVLEEIVVTQPPEPGTPPPG